MSKIKRAGKIACPANHKYKIYVFLTEQNMKVAKFIMAILMIGALTGLATAGTFIKAQAGGTSSATGEHLASTASYSQTSGKYDAEAGASASATGKPSNANSLALAQNKKYILNTDACANGLKTADTSSAAVVAKNYAATNSLATAKGNCASASTSASVTGKNSQSISGSYAQQGHASSISAASTERSGPE